MKVPFQVAMAHLLESNQPKCRTVLQAYMKCDLLGNASQSSSTSVMIASGSRCHKILPLWLFVLLSCTHDSSTIWCLRNEHHKVLTVQQLPPSQKFTCCSSYFPIYSFTQSLICSNLCCANLRLHAWTHRGWSLGWCKFQPPHPWLNPASSGSHTSRSYAHCSPLYIFPVSSSR